MQVDWSVGAGTINYITARNRVGLVADVLSNFLNFLVNNGFTDMSRVSIAGHSLGAHIAGLTGKRTQAAGRRIQVIWGLGTKFINFLNLIFNRLSINHPQIQLVHSST